VLKEFSTTFASIEEQIFTLAKTTDNNPFASFNRRKSWDDISRQMEMLKHTMEAQQKRQESFSQDLTLRVALAETRFMRIVALVTLAFGPIQVVSAIFATPIFPFQNWHKGSNQGSQKGIIAYILACVLLNATSFVIWFLYDRRYRTQWGTESLDVAASERDGEKQERRAFMKYRLVRKAKYSRRQ
jgi:hypothetical protein